MIPLFSQKYTKEDNMLAFFPVEKNEIMLLTYEKKWKRNDFVSLKRQKNYISWINSSVHFSSVHFICLYNTNLIILYKY